MTDKEKQKDPVQQCPDCKSALVARKGKNGKFIGCTKYPKCNYTRNIIKRSHNVTKRRASIVRPYGLK